MGDMTALRATLQNGDTGVRRRAALSAATVAAITVGAVLRVWQLGRSRLHFPEAFTAVVGRLPVAGMVSFLRVHDSHPPLDYLLRAPLARASASAFVLRLPSALMSIAALALFGWWSRRFGRVGAIATWLMAISSFEIVYGREARMYADMQLIGVLALVLADAWYRRPRRWHAPAMGLLIAVGLLTHVSAWLLLVGLVVLAGRRSDREAWRWRAALAGAAALWVALWGRTFLVQAHGGHSSWIPRTTPARVVSVVGSLITSAGELRLAAFVALVAGGIVIARRRDADARVWLCCFALPTMLTAVGGRFVPLLLDRTMTVFVPGAFLAVGVATNELLERLPRASAIACIATSAVLVGGGVSAATSVAQPDGTARYLERVVRRGDVVAMTPPGKSIELLWAIGVRSVDGIARVASVPELPSVRAIAFSSRHMTGRTWLVRSSNEPNVPGPRRRCAAPKAEGHYRIYCVRYPEPVRIGHRL
jgi:hypothetical protein